MIIGYKIVEVFGAKGYKRGRKKTGYIDNKDWVPENSEGDVR